MTIDTDKLKALALAATKGPWMRLFGERTVYDRMSDGCRGIVIVRADMPFDNRDASNLDFIAAANLAAVLELIAEVERLRAAEVKRAIPPEMKAAIDEAHKTGATSALLPNGSAVFINYGDEPDDMAHLNCTACGGSGHIDDQKDIARREAPASGTEKDAARLDFIIAEQCQIEHMTRPGAAPLYRVRWPWEEKQIRAWSASGREAIDAAIAAKDSPCGS